MTIVISHHLIIISFSKNIMQFIYIIIVYNYINAIDIQIKLIHTNI
jgi:hypothetical protein